MYIYTYNETKNWDVFFDNLSIKHYKGAFVEENHYYPLGLTQQGNNSKALRVDLTDNDRKYNGIEQTTDLDLNQYDAFFRTLDPQTGRWRQIDPEPKAYMLQWETTLSRLANDTLPSGKYIWQAGAVEELQAMVAENPDATWSPNFAERVYMAVQWVGLVSPSRLGTAGKVEQASEKVVQTEKAVAPSETLLKLRL